MTDRIRERFSYIRKHEESRKNAHARHDYRERQRKHAWQDATRMLAEAFDRDSRVLVR
jgi:hypothetical protein